MNGEGKNSSSKNNVLKIFILIFKLEIVTQTYLIEVKSHYILVFYSTYKKLRFIRQVTLSSIFLEQLNLVLFRK